MNQLAEARGLTDDEIAKLLTSETARDRQFEAANRWPVYDDLLLLANAVKQRSHFVTFNNGVRYVIRYKSRYKACFIAPDSANVFVPCGYFNYEKLQNLLDELESEDETVETV